MSLAREFSMEIHHLTAFSRTAGGGNPAAVVFGTLGDSEMQRLAAELGYSETAFLPASWDGDSCPIRYYSPEREIDFCGHATIAAAVAIAHSRGTDAITLSTRSGLVPVRTTVDADGCTIATLTSIAPRSEHASDRLVAAVLGHLGWTAAVFEPKLPVAVANAGASHLLLPLARYQTLERIDYDFAGLRQTMLDHDLTTVCLFWRESDDIIRARNLFPVGGVVEDAATGAAAAALGGYLRLNELAAPGRLVVRQGVEMGRPSELLVDLPTDPSAGIAVSGAAVPIEPHATSLRACCGG